MNSAGPGIETEIKLRARDDADARARLDAAGFAVTHPRTFEANLLFDRTDGEVRARGEILRLRRFGARSVITYKGPASTGRHKSREEVEVVVDDAAMMETILARLGYEPRYRYEKYRTELARPGDDGVAVIDETPIGVFVELEGQPDWIDRTAAALGYSPADYITLSYASLWAEHCARAGRPPGIGMVYS